MAETQMKGPQKTSLLKKIVNVVLSIVIMFIIVVVLSPRSFYFSSSTVIDAPPEVVFEYVNDLRNLNKWSPWVQFDPQMTQTYEGPPAGLDASYTWSGNRGVGAGRMTIVETRPHELVGLKLNVNRPMKATCDVWFQLRPFDEKTQLTWSISGKIKFVANVYSLFMDMEKMADDQFEQGFNNLKAIVEQPEDPKEVSTH